MDKNKIEKQLKKAYKLAGLKRKFLSEMDKRYADHLFNTLISICNRKDKPLAYFENEFKEIASEIRNEGPEWSEIAR